MVVSFAGGAAVPREKFGKLPPTVIRVAQTSRTILRLKAILMLFSDLKATILLRVSSSKCIQYSSGRVK
jgi:hypothetical protein